MTGVMQGGIASLLGAEDVTLEARVELALRRVPNDAAFAAAYTDPADRMRVRRRAAIAAILDAVFEHGFRQHLMAPETTVAVGYENADALLAGARLDFIHDQALVDGGRPAELVLRPVGRETVDAVEGITSSRQLMILGLVLIELWQRSDATTYKTRTEVRSLVARQTGMAPTTLKTQRSNFKNAKYCSQVELASFTENVDLVRQMATGTTHSPFALLLPAFLARSQLFYPRGMSAAN